ncbi:hypothetical protein GCM10027174_06250 [Salinifilum aidingensis]
MLWPVTNLVVCAVLAVFLVRLVRAPGNRALWAVVACLLLQAGGYGLQQLAYLAAANPEAGHGAAKLAQNVVLHAKYYALALFFLLSVGGDRARRRAKREGALLAVTAALITTAMYLTPPPLRDHSFSTADMQVAPIAAFYLIAGGYFIHITGAAARWSWLYGAESDRRLRAGLRTAAVGLALQAAASLLRAVFVVVRSSGGTIPEPVNTTALAMLIIANPLFLAGLLLALVLTQLARLRTWLRHRRHWYALRPLWDVLHPLYPEATLDPQAPSAGDRWRAARVHRRFWRRYVECRDGIVQLSPDLAAAGYDPQDPPRAQAAALHEAVQRQLAARQPHLSRAGYDPRAPVEQRAEAMRTALRQQRACAEHTPDLRAAVPVLTSTDADADLHQLLTLSQAVANHPETREKASS